MSSNDEGEQLRERTVTDPEGVPIEEILNALEANPSRNRSEVLEALSAATADQPRRAETAVTGLESLLDGSRTLRIAAADGLSVVAGNQPDAVSWAVPSLADQLDDDSGRVRASAARALATLGESQSESVRPVVDDVEPLLTDDAPFVRAAAAAIMTAVLPEEVDAAIPLVPALVEALEPMSGLDSKAKEEWLRNSPVREKLLEAKSDARQDRERIRTHFAAALATTAEQRPSSVVDCLPTVIEYLERESNPLVRSALLDVVGFVAQYDADTTGAAIEPVAAVLANTKEVTLQAKASWVLGLLAEKQPDRVFEAIQNDIPAIIALLDESDERVEGAAVGLLSYVAEHDPDAVRPALPQLRELLTADRATVRGGAVWALAYAGRRKDRDRLLALTDDDHDDVRAAANEALEVLEARTR